MNNSDDINLDLYLGRPSSPSSSGVDPSLCRTCPEENPLFSSPSSSGVDPSLINNYEMNNSDGINLDLRLGRPCPEVHPLFSSSSSSGVDPSLYRPCPEENPLFSSPSSSGVDPSPCKYDVFISFRGGDTRHNFTSHLYTALCRNQVKTYIDEISLKKGDDISRALPKAIEESAISIIIFSTNYATSTWCLDELLHILKCKREKSQTVLPIFLGVDPSDIRRQKRSYADAFVQHEQRFYNAIDKVQEWRQALKEASGLSGWDSQGKSESVIVDEVVKDVKEKLKHSIEDLLKSLKEELRLANRVLEDAEEKQLTDEDVREWLFNMKEVNYRADELTDKINCEELRHQLGGASESSTSFATFNKSVEDEIAEILRTLEKLDARKDKLGLKELPENRVSQRSSGTPLVLESEVYGRGDDKEAILKLLLSDETCGDKVPMVLPIVGMGGIGKTTLAQLVYKDPRVKDHFQIRVWVTISTEFTVLNITKQIYKKVISPQFDTEELFELQRELSEALEGKKYLFVLDDVWNEDYLLWDELRRPFKFGKSGSKIIITTRSLNVASTMSKVEAHYLNGLSDENCWKIFIQHAFENEDLLNAYPDLQKIGEGIVRKCKGLPLAVKSVAALLHSISSRDEWGKILENPIWDSKLPENARKVLPALWLSYCHLSLQLKRCFAYCSIFPKDRDFDKENLILLWMGEGFLEARGGKRMEDIGEEYFKILTSRSFFQPSVCRNKSRFIMHDCVHDLATFVLGDFGFRSEENNNLPNLPSKTRHLSINKERTHYSEQFDGISNAKCLRSFLSLGYAKNPPLKLLMEEGCLRVLSIHHSLILESLDSIGNLKHLRYLDVSFTSFKEIPDTISTLYNSETLLLTGCTWLTQLPTDIVNLKHLRYLDVSSTSIKELPDAICTLYNLETLLLKKCTWLTRLPTDIGNLKHLRYLDVSSTSIKEIPDTICTLYNLETLLLKHCRMLTRLPTDIVRLIKLRHLDFSGSSEIKLPLHIFYMKDPSCILGKKHAGLRIRGLENVVDVENVCEAKPRDKFFITDLGFYWVLDQLQPHTNLKKVCIFYLSGTRLSDWMGDQSFSSIVQVDLIRCNWRSLWPLDQLPSLKTLNIKESFRRVETINREFFSNSSSMTKPFRSLEMLSVRGMFKLKVWLFREGKVVFPTLKELVLNDCPKLEVRLLPDCFPSLTRLEVSDCRQVMLIPATHQGLIFPSLQELVIRGCKEQELFGEGEVVFPTLKELVLNDCPKLEVRLLPDCFPSLTRLEVSECRQVMLIPATHQGLIFPSLQELVIRGCKEQELFGEGEVVFPTLKELVLFNCPKLEVRLLPDCFPSLTRLVVSYCRQVMLIPATHQGLIFPSLQELVIRGCKEQVLFGEGEVVFPTLKELVLNDCPKLEVRLLPDCFPSLTRLEVSDCRQVMLIPATHQGLIYPSLQELVIRGCKEQELFGEGEVVFPTLKELVLNHCPKLEVWLLPDCFPSLTRLEVSYCRQVMRIPATHQGLIFPSLQELVIGGCKEQELFGEGEVVFPTLKELVLFNCPKLEVRLLPDCFPSLTRLVVSYCRQVMLIPATHQGLIFPSLQELVIRGCKEQELFGEGEVVFPTLKELVLNDCPKLEVRLLPDCFPSLTRLEVKWCRQVMLIPATHQGLIFPSLQELVIRGCKEQELILEGEVVFPTLKELEVWNCPKLEVRLLPDCFPSLTRLEVQWCRQVMLIPTTHQGLIFPSLQELVINECPEQELILEGGLPSNLERITISWCHNLKALDNNGFRLLTSLQKLEIRYCKELQCLPELPSYPFDLEIRGCPLLESRCQENGKDWLKIKHARLKLL